MKLIWLLWTEVASSNALPLLAMKTSGLFINGVTSYSAVNHASIDVIMKLFGCLAHEIS
jgi:hypothetical protein